MKAIVQDRYGSPDVLHVREVDDPAPGPRDVRVRVAAASVNAADWHILAATRSWPGWPIAAPSDGPGRDSRSADATSPVGSTRSVPT